MDIIDVTTTPPYDSAPLILVIGNFDGVHVGHQAILDVAKTFMTKEDTLAVWSFSEYPLWVFNHDTNYKQKLTPDRDKIEILKKSGVQRCYRIRFTKEYGNISGNELIFEHLSRLNVKRIVIGEGFRFGKGELFATELIDLCNQVNISVSVVPHLKENGRKVSSRNIRSLVKEGKMEAVQAQLGRTYAITGEVIHGEALGRTLGFPTINLGGTEEYVPPKPGVYLGTAEIHNEYGGNELWHVLISAGYRPTVNGKGYLIEAYLIDYEGDLYGKTVSVSFSRYMRDELKFTGLDPLKKQMELDKINAKNILGL
jgi:riboflavin kinase/FMN adenylyltransferase